MVEEKENRNTMADLVKNKSIMEMSEEKIMSKTMIKCNWRLES